MYREKQIVMIEIDRQSCIKCGKCIRDCVVEVLKAGEGGYPSLPPELARYCLNCQHCLAVCPAGALSCHGVKAPDCAGIGELPDAGKMLNLLRQRRSIRHYRNEAVSPEIIDKLKSALAWTPTGCNYHRLFFRIISDRAEMDYFRSETSKMLQLLIRTGIMRLIYPNFRRYLDEIMSGKDVIYRGAPHMIIAAVPKSAPCREADPWIALSYLDLYMQSLGLGSCWCGFAVHAFKWNPRLRKELHLPSGYRIGGVLLFGWPDVTYVRATAPEAFPAE